MKKLRFITLILLALAAGNSFAQKLSDKNAASLLKKADAATSFEGSDFAANYTIVQDKPGQGKSSREVIMYRRDSISAYTILIQSPAADKGKGYLQIDNGIWYYDPKDRQFVFTSAKEKFEGTNINNSDFAPQNYSRDYKINSAEYVKLGSIECVLFDLEAQVNNVAYPKLKLWVSKDDGLTRKREDYSASGQLLRTTAIPSYQKFKNHSVPEKMLIVDNLRGKKIDGKMQYEKTQVTIANVSFAKQKDSVYSKKYIESMSN